MVALMRTATVTGTAHPDLHTQLYWESTGEGPPLLLVMGLGLSGAEAWRTGGAPSRRVWGVTVGSPGARRSRGVPPPHPPAALAPRPPPPLPRRRNPQAPP